ncbi:hypothetical protein AVEN_24826-1 [Araneus ventricosus]|uniref:Uncharacterized protein n=1 Tax=Araneus ventricosus TaxID=182803 RepID=A0A4Y2BTR4_ARAVE|nr:hypothetical protein AVEN_24826-1 [Araneus ventricosus]
MRVGRGVSGFLALEEIGVLSYRHEKTPRHQTCRWRSLWERDIPLHFGGEEKGYISFGAAGTGGSLISLGTSVENEFLTYGSALSLPNVAVYILPFSLASSTRLLEVTLLKVFLLAVGQ